MEGGKEEILATKFQSNRNIEPIFIVEVKNNFLFLMVTFTT